MTDATFYFLEFAFVSMEIRKMQLADFKFLAQDGPVLKNAQVAPRSRKDSHSGSSNDMKKIPVKNRLERWKATRVIALSECNLEVILKGLILTSYFGLTIANIG